MDQTVKAEVAARPDVGRTVVAAVGPELLAVFADFAKALIGPVPDTCADNRFAILDHVPVFFQVSDAVAHGMGVLAQEKGLARAFGAAIQQFGRRIHHAFDIGHRVHALVMGRAGAIQCLGGRRSRFEIAPLPGLVTQRPDYHAGVILISLHHARHPVDMRSFPSGLVAQTSLQSETHTVRFDVRLVNDIKPVLVAQFIPDRIVRIMTRPDGIDIEPLHQMNIAYHRFNGDIVRRIRIMVVTVDPLEKNAFPVDP